MSRSTHEDIRAKLIRIQKSLSYKDKQMAQVIGCSRQLYQMTRTGRITPGVKILTFFVTGQGDRLLESLDAPLTAHQTPPNRFLRWARSFPHTLQQWFKNLGRFTA